MCSRGGRHRGYKAEPTIGNIAITAPAWQEIPRGAGFTQSATIIPLAYRDFLNKNGIQMLSAGYGSGVDFSTLVFSRLMRALRKPSRPRITHVRRTPSNAIPSAPIPTATPVAAVM